MNASRFFIFARLFFISIFSFSVVGIASAQTPTQPIDPLDFYFSALCAKPNEKEAWEFDVKGKPVRVSMRPFLTIRDVESMRLLPQQEANPTRSRIFSGSLQLTEWGSRRRARTTRGVKVGIPESMVVVVNKQLVSVSRVFGTPLSRTSSIGFKGTLDELAEFETQVQDALRVFHQQPILVKSELGIHDIAPGWKLSATQADATVRLSLTGPARQGGEQWAATATLDRVGDEPFVVCWESKWCVLWAATAQKLLSIHFVPDGTAEVATGELEQTLRFQDAPASVRQEIQKVFPPRDGDPATRLGSIAGTVILAGKPAPNVDVDIFTRFDEDDHEGESLKTKSGPDGTFEILNVRAPASVQIGMNVIRHRTGVTSGPSLCFHTHVAKDQRLEVTLGGEGRPIAGKIRDAENAIQDWSKSTVEFVLIPPCSDTVADLRAQGSHDLADGYESFLKAENGRAYALGPQPLAADGTFRVPRIPAAVYWIYVATDEGKVRRRVSCLNANLLPDGKSETLLELGELLLRERDTSPFAY